jgi:aldose 1-epimerase
LEIQVRNPDTKPLPFGVGFHPYFRFPVDQASIRIDDAQVEQWELENCLPTGRRLPLEGKHRLLVQPDVAKGLSGQQFDDAYRIRPRSTPASATVMDPSRDLGMRIEMSDGFRDLVIFTPPHSQAICVEPYTCVTDAINLQSRGVDTGLQVLEPGKEWRGWMRWSKLVLSQERG